MSSNSSHTRFRNTLVDLQECVDAIEALIHGEDSDGELVRPLEPEELTAARMMIESIAGLLLVISEEGDIEASDMLDYSNRTKRIVDSTFQRLNDEAVAAIRAESDDEDDSADDEFDDDDFDDDEEDDDG